MSQSATSFGPGRLSRLRNITTVTTGHVAAMNEAHSQIINDNPIGSGLDVFRAAFRSICESKRKEKESVSYSPDTIDQLDQEELQNLSISLLLALQTLKSSRLLPSSGRGKNLFSDLSTLNSSVNSDDFDPDRTNPLLKAALASNSSDALIWRAVYRAVIEPTPPPRLIASSVSQTPTIHNTSGFANSSEVRPNVDKVLKEELGPLYVGIPQFIERFFGNVAGLETAAEAALKKCTEGSDPLLGDDGWVGWPKDANQDGVLQWFTGLVEKLERFAEDYKSTPTTRRRLLGEPDLPMQGSTRDRKMDVGIVDGPDPGKNARYHWSQILVPGELKSNPSADTHSKARLDLGRYAREVLAAQDTRRYVLGFTLCGSLMRIWIFDRFGGIASEQFDIHEEALQFVSTILGFLWMSYTELGFDPTISTVDGQRVIEIERDGKTERLVIDELMRRASSIVGRATTCWKAHPEDYPQTPLVIKDSWQYLERVEEGELLQQATENNVVNVARYYFHETVQVLGIPDDIWGNVRKGLDITTAENYRSGRSTMSPTSAASTPRKSRSIAGVKRSSSQTGAILPASKRRSGSASPTKVDSRTSSLANRIHRRVILRDYGKPIYEASSRRVLLQGLEGCVEGHQSLYQAGFLHRDISINNLVINEDPDNPSWPSFLIDLDLGIKEARVQASGARGKTGTKVFMAIGALQGEQHTFMHDLESFFWVLFWICIHYAGPGQGTNVPRFDKWNYADPEELAEIKKGLVSHEGDFIKTAEENFTQYYESLVPWVNRLREVVFPGGRRWEQKDPGLYSRMKEVLHKAWQDKDVSGD